MDDRTMLELAAKAAGIEIESIIGKTLWQPDGISWNPLDDDGDALRLAVKLECRLVVTLESGRTDCALGDECWLAGGEVHFPDSYAATRRAIGRAAAEIGKGM